LLGLDGHDRRLKKFFRLSIKLFWSYPHQLPAFGVWTIGAAEDHTYAVPESGCKILLFKDTKVFGPEGRTKL
jgi:hypothetical protein